MGKVEAVLGTMLGLVALYLVIANGRETVQLINAITSGGSTIFKTLQGR